jgi:hypothetical protein
VSMTHAQAPRIAIVAPGSLVVDPADPHVGA